MTCLVKAQKKIFPLPGDIKQYSLSLEQKRVQSQQLISFKA